MHAFATLARLLAVGKAKARRLQPIRAGEQRDDAVTRRTNSHAGLLGLILPLFPNNDNV